MPNPASGGSTCPDESNNDYDLAGGFCGLGDDGCPPNYYFDEASETCLPRIGSACPEGTTPDKYGKCTADTPGVCPSGYEYVPTSNSCLAVIPGNPICDAGSYFNFLLGQCSSVPGNGCEENYFATDIEEGKIASICRVSPDAIEPAEAAKPPEDEGYAYCPLGYVMSGFGDCTAIGSETCWTLTVSVPVCTTPTPCPPGTRLDEETGMCVEKKGDDCGGLDFNSCSNADGCHWEGGACVSD